MRLRDRPAPTAPDSAGCRAAACDRSFWPRWRCRSTPDAYWVALDAARESGVPLIVIDAIELPFWPQSIATGHADVELEADRACIRELVEQATGLGLEVEHLRVRSPRPVDALLEVAGERQAGLLGVRPRPLAPAAAPVCADRAQDPQARLVLR